MEFYGYLATILTEAKLRSIVLPKTHENQYSQISQVYNFYYMTNVTVYWVNNKFENSEHFV